MVPDEDFPALVQDAMSEKGELPFEVLSMDEGRAKVRDGQVVLWNWFEDTYAVSQAFHGT